MTVTELDLARAKWIAGDRDGALQKGIAVLAQEPTSLAAAALLTQVLIASQRPFVAGEMAVRLVDAYIRRGDFAGAAAGSCLATAAEEDAAALRKQIAAAFGKGSARLDDQAALAPPPLPSARAQKPNAPRTTGDVLLDQAETALQTFLASDDAAPPNGKLPKLPLVSMLEPNALEQLLSSFALRDVGEGKTVVREGEDGHEAFIVVSGVLHVVRTAKDDEEQVLAALGPGAIFGEMALVADAPRAASVIAAEPSQILVMAREDLEKLAQKVPALGRELGAFCHQRMVSNLIRHSQILRAVTPASRAELMARFKTRTFEGGESILKQGAEGDGLYLIASGSVEVSSKDADGDRLTIAMLGPGDVVGEISLVLRRPATADVVAKHATVALELRREDFQDAIRAHPTLLGELYELATQREEQTRSVVAQAAVDVDDIVLL